MSNQHEERERREKLEAERQTREGVFAEIDAESEKTIREAAELLKIPRAMDNSSFQGMETSPQQNETLDIIVQATSQLEKNKTALEKIKAAGLDPKAIGAQNLGRKGVGPLKGYEIVSRTKDTAMLLKGKSLYIYELKKMALVPPATGIEEGDGVTLIWPLHKERAQLSIIDRTREVRRSFVRALAQEKEDGRR